MPKLDPLTGLRAGDNFERRLEGLMERAAASGEPLSLLIADFGGLRNFNQTYGRDVGDLALRAMGVTMSATLTDSALCFRLGGDAFVAVLVGADTAEAAAKAETLGRAINVTRLESDGQVIPLAASVGYATYPREAATSRALIRLADRRLRAPQSYQVAG